MTQYGFFFDQSRCTACHACAVACKSWNMLDPGPVKLARVFEWETGVFPELQIHALFAPCYHCANPACVTAAGDGSLIKEPTYGAVLIDPAKATNASLRAAWNACPYGAIAFDSNAPNATAYKCNMCIDRLQNNQLPACVTACPMRALDFGPLSDLQKKYGNVTTLDGVPDGSAVGPSVVFKPTQPAQKIVPYDKTNALTLLAERGEYPPFFTNPSDVTDTTGVRVGRSKLDMKASSVEELMATTAHDEG